MKGGFRLSALFLVVVGVAVWAAFFFTFIVQFGGPSEITVGEWVLSGGGSFVSFLGFPATPDTKSQAFMSFSVSLNSFLLCHPTALKCYGFLLSSLMVAKD